MAKEHFDWCKQETEIFRGKYENEFSHSYQKTSIPSASTINQVNVHGTGIIDGLVKTKTGRGNANSTTVSFVISNESPLDGLDSLPSKPIDDHHDNTIHSI
jgi:hypothetical protein